MLTRDFLGLALVCVLIYAKWAMELGFSAALSGDVLFRTQ